MALKLDISKAYDRVSWSFLEAIMLKMGFDKKWESWMMMCVSSVEYSVLMNSEEAGPIIHGRGLRQGDPLSPFLYIICAKGLSCLIKKAEMRGLIRGIKICRGAPIVSHLFFADDSFLFFKQMIEKLVLSRIYREPMKALRGNALTILNLVGRGNHNPREGVNWVYKIFLII